MEPARAASARGAAGHGGERGEARRTRSLPRRLHLVFAAAALLFCAPYLRPGRVLLPTSLATMPPWSEPGASAPPSNDLMADALVLTLPERVRNGASLRAGEIPSWNPRIFGGYPHLAMIQNDALYPLSAPFDALEPVSGMAWSIALHLALAGSLAAILLRETGVSRGGAIVGGIAFALNGFFLVRASAPSYVFSGTWFPLVLLGARRLARGGRLRDGLPLVGGVAMALLGGHPQVVSLETVAAAAYAAWSAWNAAGARREDAAVETHRASPRLAAVARTALLFAGATLLGAALVAFQLLPFVELLRHSARTAVPLREYLASALPPPALAQAFLPDLFGHPVDGDWWFGDLAPLLDGSRRGERFWAFNYSGENLFTGVAPLFLAAAALARPRRRDEVVFLAAMGSVALATLLLPPLLALAWLAVPGFGASRPDRVLFLWIAAVSLLAGHGFDSVVPRFATEPDDAGRRVDADVRPLVAPLLAALGVVVAWWLLPVLFDGGRRADLLAWMREAGLRVASLRRGVAGQLAVLGAQVLTCAGLAIASRRRRVQPAAITAFWAIAVALPNLCFGWRFNPAQPRPVLGETTTERLVAEHAPGHRLARILARGPVFPANVPDLLGIDDANGASAAGLDRYAALVEAFDPRAISKMKYFPALRDPEVARGPLLDLLSVAVVISDRVLPPPWQQVGEEDGLVVSRHPAPGPRHRVVEEVVRLDDDGEALRRMTAPGFDPSRTAIVAGADPPRPAAASTGAGPSPVDVERSGAHRIDLRVNAPRGGLLVSSEVDYPGWEATVDGAPAPVLRTDVALRGVAVPPGEHRVSFAFVPRSFRYGLAASLVAAAALALLTRRRA